MRAVDVGKPLAVFAVVVLLILGGTAVVASLSGGGGDSTPPTEGDSIEGQSPRQYQPDAVIADRDPETGNLSLDTAGEAKQILIDTRHTNQYDDYDLEPLIEILVANGHDVDVRNVDEPADDGSSGSFGQEGYSNGTLQRYDAYFSIAPTSDYTDREVNALQSFAAGDGRVVLLGEPTQFAGGSLSGASPSRPSGDQLAGAFGVRIGGDSLYNLADDANDNNYQSIYASPTGTDDLTEGVDRLQFDTAGYISLTADSDADVLVESVAGTKTLTRGQTGQYPIVARNDTFVLVADASFLERSELYDVDNEQFVSNLLAFLVGGEKETGVPPTPTPTPTPENGGFEDGS